MTIVEQVKAPRDAGKDPRGRAKRLRTDHRSADSLFNLLTPVEQRSGLLQNVPPEILQRIDAYRLDLMGQERQVGERHLPVLRCFMQADSEERFWEYLLQHGRPRDATQWRDWKRKISNWVEYLKQAKEDWRKPGLAGILLDLLRPRDPARHAAQLHAQFSAASTALRKANLGGPFYPLPLHALQTLLDAAVILRCEPEANSQTEYLSLAATMVRDLESIVELERSVPCQGRDFVEAVKMIRIQYDSGLQHLLDTSAQLKKKKELQRLLAIADATLIKIQLEEKADTISVGRMIYIIRRQLGDPRVRPDSFLQQLRTICVTSETNMPTEALASASDEQMLSVQADLHEEASRLDDVPPNEMMLIFRSEVEARLLEQAALSEGQKRARTEVYEYGDAIQDGDVPPAEAEGLLEFLRLPSTRPYVLANPGTLQGLCKLFFDMTRLALQQLGTPVRIRKATMGVLQDAVKGNPDALEDAVLFFPDMGPQWLHLVRQMHAISYSINGQWDQEQCLRASVKKLSDVLDTAKSERFAHIDFAVIGKRCIDEMNRAFLADVLDDEHLPRAVLDELALYAQAKLISCNHDAVRPYREAIRRQVHGYQQLFGSAMQ